jgi:hypothetical protein
MTKWGTVVILYYCQSCTVQHVSLVWVPKQFCIKYSVELTEEEQKDNLFKPQGKKMVLKPYFERNIS